MTVEELPHAHDQPFLKLSSDALADFVAKSIALKQAESAFKAAQLAYAEAVKRLSEEAVK